jgi:hypothetical protein
MKDIHYRMYISIRFFSLFDSTFIFFSSYSLSFWTNRPAIKAGMVFVIYLTCLYIIHTHTHIYIYIRLYETKPVWWEWNIIIIIILYELENDQKSVKKYPVSICIFLLYNQVHLQWMRETDWTLYMSDSCLEFWINRSY